MSEMDTMQGSMAEAMTNIIDDIIQLNDTNRTAIFDALSSYSDDNQKIHPSVAYILERVDLAGIDHEALLSATIEALASEEPVPPPLAFEAPVPPPLAIETPVPSPLAFEAPVPSRTSVIQKPPLTKRVAQVRNICPHLIHVDSLGTANTRASLVPVVSRIQEKTLCKLHERR